MNGIIVVNCEAGKGSTFTVKLPITKLRQSIQEINTLDSYDSRVMQVAAIRFSDIYMD